MRADFFFNLPDYLNMDVVIVRLTDLLCQG